MDHKALERMRQPHPRQREIDAQSVQVLRQSQGFFGRDQSTRKASRQPNTQPDYPFRNQRFFEQP